MLDVGYFRNIIEYAGICAQQWLLLAGLRKTFPKDVLHLPIIATASILQTLTRLLLFTQELQRVLIRHREQLHKTLKILAWFRHLSDYQYIEFYKFINQLNSSHDYSSRQLGTQMFEQCNIDLWRESVKAILRSLPQSSPNRQLLFAPLIHSQQLMTVELKREVKLFFQKQLKNERKELIVKIYSKLGREGLFSKAHMIDHLSNHVSREIISMKEMGRTQEEATNFAAIFLKDNARTITRAREQIDTIILSYFTGADLHLNSVRPSRYHFEVVPNAWNESSQSLSCICPKMAQFLEKNTPVSKCYKCKQNYHSQCFWLQEKDKFFQCPLCFLKGCVPSKATERIIFAGYLKRSNEDKIEYKINFNLEHKKEKWSYQIRCARFELPEEGKQNKESRFELTWPANCSISLNQKKMCQFKALSCSSSLKRRADEEVRLQKAMLNSVWTNQLVIDQKHTHSSTHRYMPPRDHLIVILAVNNLNDSQLLSKFQRSRMPIQECKDILKQASSTCESQATIERVNVSLQCQLYQTKITIPVRSKQCNSHYQPFDLRNFVIANLKSKNPTLKWKCPICKTRAYDLVIDELILNAMSKRTNISEITFLPDGEVVYVDKPPSQHKGFLQILSDGEPQIQNHSNTSRQLPNLQHIQCKLMLEDRDPIEISDGEDVSQSVKLEIKPKRLHSALYFQNRNQDYVQSKSRFIRPETYDRFFESEEVNKPNLCRLEDDKLEEEKPEEDKPEDKPWNQILHREIKMSTRQKFQLFSSRPKQKMIPEISQKVMNFNGTSHEVIEIPSDDESFETNLANNLRYQQEELNKEIQDMKRIYGTDKVTPREKEIFNQICNQIFGLRLD